MRRKKIIKKFILIILIIFLLMLLFVTMLFIYNQVKLKKEAKLIKHKGEYVEIDGKKMNIYVEGEGDKTLVFMAGANTPAVIYEFKPLYMQLKEKYRIVVIEKFGYGYSDDIDGERNLSTLLRQDREALKKVGLKEPYILCPHSASGLEAIRWAQLYPDEVEAIIGLDMGVPEQFDYQIGSLEDAKTETYEERLKDEDFYNFWMYTVGGYRLYNIKKVFPILKGDFLTTEEKEEYKAITYYWYSQFHKTSMYREGLLTESQLKDFKDVYSASIPDIPTLQFVSNDSSTFSAMLGENGLDKWKKIHQNYIANLSNASIVYLKCGHYLHAEEPKEVCKHMIDFIENNLK